MAEPHTKSILNIIDDGVSTVNRIFYYIGAFTTVPMMLLVAGSAFYRYILHKPISGAPEITSFMLVFMVFMIGGYCQFKKINVSMGILVDRFSERAQVIIDSVTFFICIIVSVVLVYASIKQGLFMSETGTYSQVLRIPIFFFYYIIAVGWAAIALSFLSQTIHLVLKAVKN